MTEDDIDYVLTWLRNYITLYIIHGENEAYAMVDKLGEVLRNEDERSIDVESLKKEIVEAVFRGELTGEEMQKIFRFIYRLEKKDATKGVL